MPPPSPTSPPKIRPASKRRRGRPSTAAVALAVRLLPRARHPDDQQAVGDRPAGEGVPALEEPGLEQVQPADVVEGLPGLQDLQQAVPAHRGRLLPGYYLGIDPAVLDRAEGEGVLCLGAGESSGRPKEGDQLRTTYTSRGHPQTGGIRSNRVSWCSTATRRTFHPANTPCPMRHEYAAAPACIQSRVSSLKIQQKIRLQYRRLRCKCVGV